MDTVFLTQLIIAKNNASNYDFIVQTSIDGKVHLPAGIVRTMIGVDNARLRFLLHHTYFGVCIQKSDTSYNPKCCLGVLDLE